MCTYTCECACVHKYTHVCVLVSFSRTQQVSTNIVENIHICACVCVCVCIHTYNTKHAFTYIMEVNSSEHENCCTLQQGGLLVALMEGIRERDVVVRRRFTHTETHNICIHTYTTKRAFIYNKCKLKLLHAATGGSACCAHGGHSRKGRGG